MARGELEEALFCSRGTGAVGDACDVALSVVEFADGYSAQAKAGDLL